MLLGAQVIGVVEFFTYAIRPPDSDQLATLFALGGQIGQFMERKRVEGEQQKLASLVENSTDFIGIASPGGEAVFVNRAGREMVGISEDRVRGTTILDYVADEDRERVSRVVLPAVAEHGRWEGETIFRNFGAETTIPMFQHIFSISQQADGRTVALGTISRDITDRKRAENDLRRSEAYLAEAQRLSHTGSWAWNIVTGDLYWSDEQFRIVGLDPLKYKPSFPSAMNVIHPEDRDYVEQSFKKATRATEDFELDCRIVRPDGSIRWIHSLGHPMFNTAGELTEYVGTIIDTTERRRAEEALRRSQAHLAEGQRISKTGSCVWSAATGELLMSEEHRRIFGVAPEDVKQTYESFLQRVHPEDRSKVERIVERTLQDKCDFDMEYRICRPDGSLRNIHALGHPVLNESGTLTNLIGTVMDTTDQKQAEERIRDSERRFRHLVEAIPHHVWSVCKDGTMGYWNQRLVHYTGLSTEELRQGRWAAVHPGDVGKVRAAWDEAWAKCTIFEQEQRIRATDGTWRRFLCRAVPVPNGAGDVFEWFGTDTDIEERRRAEEALQDAQAELSHVSRVITFGELSASIAHEISQPLAAVVSYGNACVRWLDRAEPNLEEARWAAMQIVREGTRAGDVLSRIRSVMTKEPRQFVTVDVNDVVREVLTLTEQQFLRHNVLTRTILAPNLRAVAADPVQIQQVLVNLLVNAIDAVNARGEGNREVCIATENRNSREIWIAVRDSGVGIDPASADQLFKPFFTKKPKSMGMGLSISRSIVEAHSGHLWASTNEDHGATFQFTLPALGALAADSSS